MHPPKPPEKMGNSRNRQQNIKHNKNRSRHVFVRRKKHSSKSGSKSNKSPEPTTITAPVNVTTQTPATTSTALLLTPAPTTSTAQILTAKQTPPAYEAPTTTTAPLHTPTQTPAPTTSTAQLLTTTETLPAHNAPTTTTAPFLHTATQTPAPNPTTAPFLVTPMQTPVPTTNTGTSFHTASGLSGHSASPQLQAVPQPAHIHGSRIINIDLLQNYITRLTTHSSQCDGNVILSGEMRDGLASIVSSYCDKCSQKIVLETSPKVSGPRGYQRWECNLAAVWGQLATGGGHAPLQESMSVLGVPVMTKRTFIQTERDIGEWWGLRLGEYMVEAGREEKRLAIERGEYHQGVPAITVIVDGGWSKRSHKHSYNAKSGVGVIIGKNTGKLLYIGVRNKFCTACTQGHSKDDHSCYKNWDKSSSQMETDILVEGFCKAESTHGVRYMHFIGDGDSSVYSTLLQHVPVWGRHIMKIECANHACKCYRTSLEKLVIDNPSYKGKGGLTLKMRKRLTSAARCAIKMRSKESNQSTAIKLLERDLFNGPLHCFGHHDGCSTDFCTAAQQRQALQDVTREENQEGNDADSVDIVSQNILSTIQDQGSLWEQTVADTPAIEADARQGGQQPTELTDKLLHDIQVIISRLVAKVPQLIGNFTTNLAESWMHMRCKFDGHKAINRSQSGSWEHRCMGAGLRLNLGQAWGPQSWTELTSTHNVIYQSATEAVIRKSDQDRKHKSTDTAKMKRRQSKYSKVDDSTAARRAYSRHDNGALPVDVTEDVSQEYLTRLMDSFYATKVTVSPTDIRTIEVKTHDQNSSELWKEERYKRVTASVVGGICKLQKKTKRSKKVESMLYSRFHGNRATQYGRDMERISRNRYVTYQRNNGHPGLQTHFTGLIISHQNPWIAATPDDRVHDPVSRNPWGLAEYKNPYTARHMTLSEACEQLKSTFCLEKYDDNGVSSLKLKQRHDYYYQIQCQLYCDGKLWCDFVVCTEKDIHVQRVIFAPEWWNEQLLKLKVFYFHSLLPELACPRFSTGGIRESVNSSTS